jgi:CheY-specific phosphatase CheX
MDPERRAMLFAVVAEVLERQAFMFATEGPPAEEVTAPDTSLHAAMGFTGTVRGTMELAAPVELCTELTGNLLGLEPDDPAARADAADALKELLNVVCGQYLSTAYGSQPVFRLSIPSVVEIDATGWERLAAGDTALLLDVDGAPALVRYTAEAVG